MRNSGGSSDSEDSIPLGALKDVNSYKCLREPTCEKCEFCDQTFNTRLSSIKHNATHIIIPLLKLSLYQCDECLYHFSFEDLRSHVLKSHHHTSQFPNIKIKASQIHTLKTVGYEKLLQSMVTKQAVVKCQDTLNEILSLKSADEHKSINLSLDNKPKAEVSDTEVALNIEVKGPASKIEVKEEPVYEISSDSDTEEYKKENGLLTREQEFLDQKRAGTQMDSEHERGSSSPLRKDLSSPSPIYSPNYEPVRNRIVFEDDGNDDLFEAELILPDKPYSPKKSKVPIRGTNISMMDKTGNSFLIGRQPNKLDALTNSFLNEVQPNKLHASNSILIGRQPNKLDASNSILIGRQPNKLDALGNSFLIGRQPNKLDALGNSFLIGRQPNKLDALGNSFLIGRQPNKLDALGNSFLIGRQPNKLDSLNRSYLEAIHKSIEEDSNVSIDRNSNNRRPDTNSGNNSVNNRIHVNNGNNFNNGKSVVNNATNFNNGKSVMNNRTNVNNGEPVRNNGNIVSNREPVTNSENNVMNNGNVVTNNKRPFFGLFGKQAVNNIIVDESKEVDNNEISKVDEESYTESVHYDDLIAPQLCDCRHCGRCFANRMELIIHESTHMQLKQKQARSVLCCVCEKYLSGNHWALRRHMLSNHPEDIDRKFRAQKRCKRCDMKYYSLLKHMRMYHLTRTCLKCNQNFDRGYINNHNCDVANTLTLNTYKVIKLCEMCLAFARNKTNVQYDVTGQHCEVGSRQTCDKCHAKHFEVNLVRRKTIPHKEGTMKLKKPMSNADRLKKMQNRLKIIQRLNKF